MNREKQANSELVTLRIQLMIIFVMDSFSSCNSAINHDLQKKCLFKSKQLEYKRLHLQ